MREKYRRKLENKGIASIWSHHHYTNDIDDIISKDTTQSVVPRTSELSANASYQPGFNPMCFPLIASHESNPCIENK